jgi:hypothetical protein
MYKELDIDNFDITHGPIELSPSMLLYRGYNERYPAIGTRPAFYAFDRSICDGYADREGCRLGAFITTRTLRFFDLRYIRCILGDLFAQRKSNCDEVIECCNTLALAYGVCSLRRQMELYLQRYREKNAPYESMVEFAKTISGEKCISGVDPVEARGVRIAEVNNDAEAVLLLKEVFGSEIDGYIAPRLYSPYHIEKRNKMMNAELVLFNPISCGLKPLPPEASKESTIVEPMSWLWSFHDTHFKIRGFEQPKLKLKGGSVAQDADYDSTPNSVLERDDASIRRLEKRAIRVVAKMKGGVGLNDPRGRFESPVPVRAIHPWTS